MEALPCSRVAHIARTKKPYSSDIGVHTRRNALRVAEVWMDEHKSSVYMAWNLPMEVRGAFSAARPPAERMLFLRFGSFSVMFLCSAVLT